MRGIFDLLIRRGEGKLSDDSDDSVLDSVKLGGLSGGGESMRRVLDKIRTFSMSREERFREYRKVSRDVLVSQAIENMADDAVQFDVDTRRTVWVECASNRTWEKRVNRFLAENFEPLVHEVAEYVLRYGEFGLRVVREDVGERAGVVDGVKGDDGYGIRLSPILDIERLHHIVTRDQQHLFVFSDSLKRLRSDEVLIYDSKDIVHFISLSLENSEEVEVDGLSGRIRERGDRAIILQGRSVITDKVLESYRILVALEDAVISSRMDKSKALRIINVDVSRLSNDKAQEIVNYLDSAINKNESISGVSDSYEASRVQAESVNIVMPVKQDKGRVSVEEYTPSSDFKEVVDLDHFFNKFIAGLRVPRPYLLYDDSLPGQGSSGSLLRMDIRYARAVKRVQRVILDGVRDLVEVLIAEDFPEGSGRSVPAWNLRIVKIMSPEDEERNLELEDKFTTSSTFIDYFWDGESYDIPKLRLMIDYFSNVVMVDEVVSYLRGVLKDAEAYEAERAERGEEEESIGGRGGGRGGW